MFRIRLKKLEEQKKKNTDQDLSKGALRMIGIELTIKSL